MTDILLIAKSLIKITADVANAEIFDIPIGWIIVGIALLISFFRLVIKIIKS